jgi:hypothetical protein
VVGLAVQAVLKWGRASATAGKALRYLAAKKDAAGNGRAKKWRTPAERIPY